MRRGRKWAPRLDGTVRDSGGGAVAGAAVTVRNTATNQGRALVTEQDGSFHAAELSAGTYEVMAEREWIRALPAYGRGTGAGRERAPRDCAGARIIGNANHGDGAAGERGRSRKRRWSPRWMGKGSKSCRCIAATIWISCCWRRASLMHRPPHRGAAPRRSRGADSHLAECAHEATTFRSTGSTTMTSTQERAASSCFLKSCRSFRW